MSEFSEKTAHDLSWSELLTSICHAAVNAATVERLQARLPFTEQADAARAQTLVSEALTLFERDAPLPVSAAPDVREVCNVLQRAAAASGEQFRDAQRVIEQALRLRQHSQYHKEQCPELERLLWCDPNLGGLHTRISRAIDEHGAVQDGASEGLRTARHKLNRARQQQREQSNQLLTRFKDALSGTFVAERGGRFVLPVRAETQSQVPGMILGSSGSGGTLYVEPKELTELNNRVYIAEAEALREEAKVLWELSESAASLAPALARAWENCIQADELSTVARWAHRHHCVPIQFVDERVLELYAMRHPLLLGQGEVVPNDLELRAGQCLVVSGPNAGGKTVALKCLGLTVWLAQSGFPVPCGAQSRIGWFERVLTDIGDDQSISRSLSTFSAHITHLAQYLELAEPGSLVLLDEVAGGTDPDEGAALAASVLEHFVAAGAAVATTTHYERLKRLGAGENKAFVNASVGFDFEQMRPTFRLSFGTPGQSSALAVAERYGISQELIAHALELLPKDQQYQRQLLEQLEQQRAELNQLRQQAAQELELQKRAARDLELETERERERQQRALQQDAASLTQEVQHARTLLQQAKSQLHLATTMAQLQSAERLIGEAAAPITIDGALTRALHTSADGNAIAPELLVPGLQVRIPHLGSNGEVVSTVSKGAVRVNVGGMKLSIPVDKLRPIEAQRPAPRAPQPNKHAKPRRTRDEQTAAPASSFLPVRTTLNTCDLRGQRVEAGLDNVGAFLDRMLRAGEPAAYILHGHGTGAMKEAVREYLGQCRHVARFEPAAKEDGGDALTLCWL